MMRPRRLGLANDRPRRRRGRFLRICREKRPLVGVRQPLLVEKHAVAEFPRPLLQRQRDQIAEAALRQRVLVGEEAVVGIQADVRPAFHGFRQQVRAEFAGQGGRDGLGEEQPDCPPLPDRDRSRAAGKFMPRHVSRTACGVFPPMRLVEIGRQEEAGFVRQHRIDAHDEIAAVVVLAGQMPANHFVGYGQKSPVWTLGALDSGLFAHARTHSLAHAGG